MKTVKLSKQTFNNSFTRKNQKIMKTKKYSISLKALAAVVFAFVFSALLNAQFDIAAGTTTQTPVSEEREGNTGLYTATGVHVAGDRFTWEIWADTPPVSVESGGVDIIDGGSGTLADPYYVNLTDDLTSIDIEWAADAVPGIINTNGNVSVQKRLAVASGGCASPIQSWDIDFWSDPSAAVDVITSPNQIVCSTDAIGGTITIDLTGAPDAGQSGLDGFDLVYVVAVSDPLLTINGPLGTAEGSHTVTSDLATVTIPLPTDLTNTDTSPHTYTVTLSTIQDDFNNPAVAVAGEVFTITVNPVPETGVISSSSSLTRR